MKPTRVVCTRARQNNFSKIASKLVHLSSDVAGLNRRVYDSQQIASFRTVLFVVLQHVIDSKRSFVIAITVASEVAQIDSRRLLGRQQVMRETPSRVDGDEISQRTLRIVVVVVARLRIR